MSINPKQPTDDQAHQWGASPAEWDAFINLDFINLRPVASCPIEVPGSKELDTSRMKVPSFVLGNTVRRLKGWPALKDPKRQRADIDHWRLDSRHGISLVLSNIHAIDIDVDDAELASEIDDFWCRIFDADLPVRGRTGSSRIVLLFRLNPDENGERKSRKKNVVPLGTTADGTPRGMVEFLFNRCQIVAAGAAASGGRYYWPHGIPESVEDIPSIDADVLNEALMTFADEFGVPHSAITGFEDGELGEDIERRRDQVDRDDPIFNYVINHASCRAELADGKLAIRCPWSHTHSNPAADEFDLTKTVFFPAGLGGENKDAAFVCQHTSHGPKTLWDYLDAIGYTIDQFPVLEESDASNVTRAVDVLQEAEGFVELDQPSLFGLSQRAVAPVVVPHGKAAPSLMNLKASDLGPDPGRPEFIRVSKSGNMPANESNLLMALNWPHGLGYDICKDEFTDDIMVRAVRADGRTARWKRFGDTDYFKLSVRLIEMGFLTISTDKLRSAVAHRAESKRMDMAIDWISSLQWDGIDRISTFAADVLGCIDTPYTRAVAQYMWTALAGRVMVPGCQVDMAPVLIGSQGQQKTKLVRAMAPDPGMFSDIDLASRDSDTARELRGKIVVELGELRGIGTRDEESIKSWMTRVKEEWIPKYKEFPQHYLRRFVLFGTTNNGRFLADATGNRRWLPMEVAKTRPQVDLAFVEENLAQLWAQAAVMFKANGVMWRDAETLARDEHSKYMRTDPTEQAIRHWLQRTGGVSHFDTDAPMTTLTILTEALNLKTALGSARHAQDVYRAMTRMGWYENDEGIWTLPFL